MIESIEVKEKRYTKIVILFTILMIAIFVSMAVQVYEMLKSKQILEPVCTWRSGSRVTFVNPEQVQDADDAIEVVKKYTNETDSSSYFTYDRCVGYVVEVRKDYKIVDRFIVCQDGYVYKFEEECAKGAGILETYQTLPEKLKNFTE